MQHGGKPETCPFFATFLINKKATGGQLLKINHKHGYIPKYSNKYNNKNRICSTQIQISTSSIKSDFIPLQ